MAARLLHLILGHDASWAPTGRFAVWFEEEVRCSCGATRWAVTSGAIERELARQKRRWYLKGAKAAAEYRKHHARAGRED